MTVTAKMSGWARLSPCCSRELFAEIYPTFVPNSVLFGTFGAHIYAALFALPGEAQATEGIDLLAFSTHHRQQWFNFLILWALLAQHLVLRHGTHR